MKKPPTSLTVLCGIWLVVGVLETLRGLLGVTELIRLQIAGAPASHPAELTRVMPVVIAAGYAFTLVQLAVAVLIVVSAIHLYKLRAWARTSLEVVSWVGLVTVIGVGLFTLVMFLEATSRGRAQSGLDWIGWVILAAFTLLSTPLGVSIRVLRGRALRELIVTAEVEARMVGGAASAARLPYEIPRLPGG